MEKITHLNFSRYTPAELASTKGRQRLYVVISTLGEREADLAAEKVRLVGDELAGVVDRVFLSHRREHADAPDRTEQRVRAADPNAVIIITNAEAVPDMGDERGKGADMRRTLYHINTHWRDGLPPEDIVIVFLDADVSMQYFGAHFVTGLAGAVFEGYDFAKAGFWRAMGRVKKYMAQPLFSAIAHPAVRRLTAFSYPLSGEVAGTLAFFNAVCFWQMYGIETGMAIDSCFQGYRMADVNLGRYDHDHNSDLGIQKIAFGVVRTWLRQMVEYGVIELKDGAAVNDILQFNAIDENGERQFHSYDLTERKYAPLKEIV
ncbi:MAG TPA: hypothetical protein PKM65_17275 [Spirochaetota bacterium]|nr:hypothetical protein [Spirochaetota bacterium]HNT12221.1 hypothetical protein [Spirochaetota bacterium]